MAAHQIGYIIIILLQQLVITGLLWAILHLLRRARVRTGTPARTHVWDTSAAGRERARQQFDELYSEQDVEVELQTQSGRAG